MRTFAIVWLKWSHLSGQCTTTTPQCCLSVTLHPFATLRSVTITLFTHLLRAAPFRPAGVNVCLCTPSVARLSHGWITICPPCPQHTSSPSGTMDTVLNYFIDDSSSVTLFLTFFSFLQLQHHLPPLAPPTPWQLG